MIKKLLFIVVITLITILITSCSSIKGVFGKSSSNEVKQSTKIENVEKAQNRNVQSKMDQVAILASGTDHALNKITNSEPPVSIARDINNRVISLAGKPDLNAEKEMWETVDNLTSQLSEEKEKGKKSLEKKDKEISEIQLESKHLLDLKNSEIEKYMKLSKESAMLADTRKSELDEYKGWFGLKAVIKGLWQFVTSSIWIIGAVILVYLLLRSFASTNPLVGAIFSIIEQIAAGIIHLIQGIAPKAAQFASFIPKKTFDGYKQTLNKLVDTMELLKDTQKRIGKQYSLDEILSELSKSMSDDDKSRIDEVKKDTGW